MLIGSSVGRTVGMETVFCPQDAGVWAGLAGSRVVGAAVILGTSVAWRTCWRDLCGRRARGLMILSTSINLSTRSFQLWAARVSQSLSRAEWL